MKMSHRDAASQLQEIGMGHHFHVNLEGNAIRISKSFPDKRFPVEMLLTRKDDGEYDMQPPDYSFHPWASHYRFAQEEKRFCYNKSHLAAFFNLFRRADIFDIISNRFSFLVVNDNCKFAQKHAKDLKAKLKVMTYEFQVIKGKQHKTLGKKHGTPRRKIA